MANVINDIGIFLTNSKGTVAQIPINPQEISISGQGNNANMEIVALGEISILKKRKLQTIKWESWFPYDSYHPLTRTKGQFKKPDWYVKFIEKIRKSCKPCKLVITGLDITMDVSIENFSYTHKGGESEDKYYSIELKEYKPYSIGVVPTSKKDMKRWGSVLGSTSSNSKTQTSKKITVGSVVILNGKAYNNADGGKHRGNYNNYVGKCTMIKKKSKYPYFIQSQTNRWLGWASKKSVRLG